MGFVMTGLKTSHTFQQETNINDNKNRTNLHVVFPTPPLPPTKIHFSDVCWITFCKVGSRGSKSSTSAAAILVELRSENNLRSFIQDFCRLCTNSWLANKILEIFFIIVITISSDTMKIIGFLLCSKTPFGTVNSASWKSWVNNMLELTWLH